MQVSVKNAETRPLPSGWKEHFDSQRNLWYYVDLNAEPPRISLAHPSELSDKHPASAPLHKSHKDHLSPNQRPVGPRNNAASSSSGSTRPSQRPRRATVAQQLYASSLTVSPKEPLRATTIAENAPDSRRPSATSTPAPEEAYSPPLAGPGSSPSTGSSARVSPTSPPAVDVHNPRNFLDCTRLAGTRRVTVSGTQPTLAPRGVSKSRLPPPMAPLDQEMEGLGVDAFYPAAVKTSPSPMPLPLRSVSDPSGSSHASPALSPDSQQGTGTRRPDAAGLHAASGPSTGAPALTPRLLMPGDASLTWNPKEDTLSAPRLPSLPPEGTPKEPGAPGARPLPPPAKPVLKMDITPPPPPILQPKPMRPLAGVSLNLQVQVAGVTSEPSPEQLADPSHLASKKKKNPLFKTLNLGISKNAKGKTPIRTIYDRQMLSSSPVTDDILL
ncbi:hypothetical protein HYPSUDRAFT_510795 [Hypholoma sublateritium FD-334 SS-4]|uniref:WW domain-containing protein n=1 Tax=Hypholoma sublateritium (strain FD-334 SS-4) TaxID=945553 RepID=A0A0D2LMQ5_HYPSF|nr:hypothetical protein HYPSUDRAFT_510795 [Hypholoma sublateritium FD-334 SS-4]